MNFRAELEYCGFVCLLFESDFLEGLSVVPFGLQQPIPQLFDLVLVLIGIEYKHIIFTAEVHDFLLQFIEFIDEVQLLFLLLVELFSEPDVLVFYLFTAQLQVLHLLLHLYHLVVQLYIL